jgi:hypothetical protein
LRIASPAISRVGNDGFRWGRPDFSTPGFFNRREFKELFEQTEEWQTKGA